MRITCDVDVCNRLLPSFNISSIGKPSRTQISVGKKNGGVSKVDDVYLMLCTKQDRNGAKYKVMNCTGGSFVYMETFKLWHIFLVNFNIIIYSYHYISVFEIIDKPKTTITSYYRNNDVEIF